MKHIFLHVLWENFLTSFLWNIKPISTPHRVVFIQNAILLLHYTGSIYQNYHLHVLLTFISFNFPAEDKNRWSYAFIYNIWYVFFLNTDWKSDKSWTFPWKYSERSDILRFRKLGRFFILDDGSAKYHVFGDGNYDKFIQCSQTDNKYLLCLRHIELKTYVNLAAEKRSFHWLFRALSSVLCELCNSFLILKVIFLFVETRPKYSTVFENV